MPTPGELTAAWAPAVVECGTETANAFPQLLRVRGHVFHADVGPSSGSGDSAPGPHDYFDAALAACKTLTATWYARKHQMPLERVEARVERDDREERKGKYLLKVRLAFHGPLSAEQRSRLYAAVGACPIHKLMTTADVMVETLPLDGGPS
jgi:putative redox protein